MPLGYARTWPLVLFAPAVGFPAFAQVEPSAAAPKMPRGFSIPLIDLDQHTNRQVVVDREPGQYLGHVTTVRLEDGKTILAVYPKGHGRGAIVMKRSTDSGLTWSERLPTPPSWATSREVPTIHRVVDAKGVKRLILFSGLYPIRMSVSEDDGATWSELKPIGGFGGIVTMGDVVRLRDGEGRYMALFHDDGRFLRGAGKVTKFQVFKTVSTDGGLTWSEPEVIAEHPTAHLCEPGAVRSPDGRQIAVLFRENSRKLNSFVIFTHDEGKTWTKPVELPGALTGDRHTCRYAPDGRLVIVFRDTTHESPTKGDFAAWVGTYDDIVAGREGQYRLRLKDNKKGADTTYPGVEVLPDGTIVATTYGHWVEGAQPYILSVRFKLSEIDEMAREQKPKPTASDPSLQPPPIHFAPGPEYADDKRRFQGIPGLEREPGGRLWATWYSGGDGEGPFNFVLLVTSADD
ncbi:MAG: exo-alpha-sialidase, partial [Planctomycetes bacterium]|nr:exo-alpha-sialidase [Planctomycetota bacterium]